MGVAGRVVENLSASVTTDQLMRCTHRCRANGSDCEECEGCEGRCQLCHPYPLGENNLKVENYSKSIFSFKLIDESPSHFWYVPPVIYPDDALQTTRANGVD